MRDTYADDLGLDRVAPDLEAELRRERGEAGHARGSIVQRELGQ
jgi:hypothetical protein